MRHYYAWCSIAGKVFVSEYEILEWFRKNHPELIMKDEDGEEDICLVDHVIFKQAFEDIARDKLYDSHPTDEPMKVADIEINMDTFSS